MLKTRPLVRALSLLLLLALLLTPAAQALTVEQAQELLTTYYVDPIPREVLEQDTIQGILDALGDPYTQYLDPETYSAFLSSMSDQTVVGIGVQTRTDADTSQGLPILEVIPGGPAEAEGLLAGDLITGVDGVDIRGMESSAIVELIRGAAGTRVRLTYVRNGERRRLSVTRSPVTVAATTGEVLDGGVGYIKCTTWGGETLAHFQELIGQMDPQVQSWIVDLRGNTGGMAQAAVDAAALFNPTRGEDGSTGSLLYFRYGDGSMDGLSSDVPCLTTKPLAVLVNEGSASASEAFCAAVRDYGLGVVVGERTYGKGVAQALLDQSFGDETIASWFRDGDALKITYSRFFSPRGNTNDAIGLIPDFQVPGEYALDAAWLLCAGFSGGSSASTVTFPWPRGAGSYTISMDYLTRDPAWAPAYTALLSAIPAGVPLKWDAHLTSRENLGEFYGLELAQGGFPDHADAWDADELDALKTYGLLNGKPDGLFHPDDPLTRAEFCQMLYNMLRCRAQETASTFSDVPADAWYAPAVCAMADLGLVGGVGEGRFAPMEPMDLQQMFTVLGRLLCRLNCDPAAATADMEAQVARGEADWPYEVTAYASWARPQVWALSCSLAGEDQPINLLWDDPGFIDPHQTATRDDAAYMMYSLLYALDFLP